MYYHTVKCEKVMYLFIYYANRTQLHERNNEKNTKKERKNKQNKHAKNLTFTRCIHSSQLLYI